MLFNLQEWNVFLLLNGLLTPLTIYLMRRGSTCMPKSIGKSSNTNAVVVLAVIMLQGALLGCTLILEHYWSVECPVALSRFQDMTAVFQSNLAFLGASQWASRAFVAEGSMLSVVRGNKKLNIWDQDSDIFLALDGSDSKNAADNHALALRQLHKLKAELETYYHTSGGFDTKYQVKIHPERWLAQVYGPNAGHGDIWIWQRQMRDGIAVIYNPDFTYDSFENIQFETSILPIRTHNWNGVIIPVANDFHKMLARQYGSSYTTPYRNRFQCVENLGSKLFPSILFGVYFLVVMVMALALPYLLRGGQNPLPLALAPLRKEMMAAVALTMLFFLGMLSVYVDVMYTSDFVELRANSYVVPVDGSAPSSKATGDTPIVVGSDWLQASQGGPKEDYDMPATRQFELDADQLKRYKETGYLVLRANQWLTDEEKDKMVEWVTEIQNWPEKAHHWMKYFESSSKEEGARLLNRVENYIPYHKGLSNIFNGPKVMGILKQVTGGNNILYKDKINMKLPGAGGFEPHQDMLAGWGAYNVSNFITFSVSIDHAHVKNGALECVSGMHTQGKLADDWSPLNTSLVESMDWKMEETFPGDAIIFDAFVPHRSAPNADTVPRRNLYLTYNMLHEGDHREQYYVDKRVNYPPDIERESGKVYEYKI